jgi:protein phosphatase 2C family protein 2/3
MGFFCNSKKISHSIPKMFLLNPQQTNCYIENMYNPKFQAGSCALHGKRESFEDRHVMDPKGKYFGVFDGHAGSGVAEFLFENVSAMLDRAKQNRAVSFKEAITQEWMSTDATILADPVLKNQGSTAVLAMLVCKCQSSLLEVGVCHSCHAYNEISAESLNVLVANVGDSQAMIVHKDGSFTALSKDHKPCDPVESKRILEAGLQVWANNRIYHEKSGINQSVSRAFGDCVLKDCHTKPASEQAVCVVPDFMSASMTADDLLLLSCDGILERLSQSEIAEFVSSCKDSSLGQVCESLCNFALESGSSDNCSAVLVHVGYKYQPNKQPFRTIIKTDAEPNECVHQRKQ